MTIVSIRCRRCKTITQEPPPWWFLCPACGAQIQWEGREAALSARGMYPDPRKEQHDRLA